MSSLLVPLFMLLTQVPGLTQAEVQAALRGEVPVRIETVPLPGGKAAGRGVGAVLVERPLDEVWATLTHFEDKPEYMPRLKSLTVLEQRPGMLRVHMVVDASVATIRYTLWFVLDEQAHALSWKLDQSASGNGIADAEGEYRLFEPAPGRTLVAYRSYVDTGRSVPHFIQDYMTRRSVPNLLHAIKARIESGGRWHK